MWYIFETYVPNSLNEIFNLKLSWVTSKFKIYRYYPSLIF